jgi:hypothetical protein
MNGLFVFGLIFLIMTLVVYPRLAKDVPENACHEAYETVENNKKAVRIFLILSIGMILGGILMMIL